MTSVLNVLSNDVSSQFENGFAVMRHAIPVEDSTATPAALIQKQSANRSLYRVDDEWLTKKRSLTNGSSGGGLEHGVQHSLCVYSGPIKLTNELKSCVEEAHVPRYTTMTFLQNKLFTDDFGIGTTLLDVGFTSRHLLSNLSKVVKKCASIIVSGLGRLWNLESQMSASLMFLQLL